MILNLYSCYTVKSAINEAYERLLKSDVKYRFVIDMASLREAILRRGAY